MAIAFRYFTDFGKPAFQHITASICGGIYARVYCIFCACTMSSVRKFTFAISSLDAFLVYSTFLQTLFFVIVTFLYVFNVLILIWTFLHLCEKQSYRRDSAGRQSLRCSRSFKVTDSGTNRKPVCDFLLVNNTNLHPVSRRFEVIADYR